jgi:hypothetical protein
MPITLPSSPGIEIVKPDYNVQYLRLLIYGDSGTGKTFLTGHADDVPELCPVLFCDADMGTMTIADRNIDVTPIRSQKDAENVVRFVRSHQDAYKTVIFDGLTSIYNIIMRTRMSSPDRKYERDQYIPELRDWMCATFQLRALLYQFKNMPANFIATALVDDRVDEATGTRILRPALSLKLAQEIGASFNIVGYLFTRARGKAVMRLLQLEPGGGRVAKNQSVYKLPAVLESPTMQVLYGRCVLGKSLAELGVSDGGSIIDEASRPKNSDQTEN